MKLEMVPPAKSRHPQPPPRGLGASPSELWALLVAVLLLAAVALAFWFESGL